MMKKKRYNKTALLLKHLQHRGAENITVLRDTKIEEAFRAFFTAKYSGTAMYKCQAIETAGESKREVLINLLWTMDEIDREGK